MLLVKLHCLEIGLKHSAHCLPFFVYTIFSPVIHTIFLFQFQSCFLCRFPTLVSLRSMPMSYIPFLSSTSSGICIHSFEIAFNTFCMLPSFTQHFCCYCILQYIFLSDPVSISMHSSLVGIPCESHIVKFCCFCMCLCISVMDEQYPFSSTSNKIMIIILIKKKKSNIIYAKDFHIAHALNECNLIYILSEKWQRMLFFFLLFVAV